MRGIATIFFLAGIFLFFNAGFNITGSAIGTQDSPPTIDLIIGLGLIFVSMVLFILQLSLDTKLMKEEKKQEKIDTQEEVVPGRPLIIDTSYLIKASEDRKIYKDLMNFIYDRNEHFQPVIVPKSVRKEFRYTNDVSAQKRENLIEEINKNALTMDERGSHENWGSEKRKARYQKIARDLLEKTPKYIAYLYLTDKDKNISPKDFLSRHDVSTKLSYNISKEEYEKSLNEIKRIFEKSDKKKKFLHNCNIGDADVDVLASALYLQHYQTIHPGRRFEDVAVISDDSHLLDSGRLFKKKFFKRRKNLDIRDHFEPKDII